jgi:hypothetical protein
MLDAVPSGALGEDLIEQGTAAAIREMRLRGKAKKAIARELDLDIKFCRCTQSPGIVTLPADQVAINRPTARRD